ncbi:MAG: type VI secretion system tip protein VgrG, partial [Myxococcales bacterium]|nr:type VI secretion system tip protein VgrG [Myxococcales bacterium]
MTEERVDYPCFVSAALPDADIRVHELRGTHELGALWEVEVSLLIDDDLLLDADALIEAPAAVYQAATGGIAEAPFYGMVREVELLRALPGHYSHYRVVLVPNLWVLTQVVRSRVFLDASVPTILEQVLGDAGLEADTDYVLSLEATYPTRELTVQYRESDFDFLARLLEHEGITFFAQVQEGHESWVFTDGSNAFTDTAAGDIPFLLRDTTDLYELGLHSLRVRTSSVPSRLITRDYAPAQPLVRIEASETVTGSGIGMVFLPDDHLRDDADAARLARVRAEELAVAGHVARATGFVRELRAGQLLTLVGHPIDELNRTWLVVLVDYAQTAEHEDTGPSMRIEMIPSDVPYRPARLTRKPRVSGIHMAHVDGEVVGVPAPLDDEGRYKVVLPWDLVGAPGGHASSWLRMAQVHSGPGYGTHFPLHVGTEVLIAYVDGDPDRP